MTPAGASRQQVALALRAAYSDGLLSQGTLAHRLDLLFGSVLVDPAGLVDDLSVRRPVSDWAHATRRALRRALAALEGTQPEPAPVPRLLALDRAGARDEIVIGRQGDCDVVLDDVTVSRRHALLTYRDGNWILRDLESTNGTAVNGCAVVRCRLLPGDRLTLGETELLVD